MIRTLHVSIDHTRKVLLQLNTDITHTVAQFVQLVKEQFCLEAEPADILVRHRGFEISHQASARILLHRHIQVWTIAEADIKLMQHRHRRPMCRRSRYISPSYDSYEYEHDDISCRDRDAMGRRRQAMSRSYDRRDITRDHRRRKSYSHSSSHTSQSLFSEEDIRDARREARRDARSPSRKVSRSPTPKVVSAKAQAKATQKNNKKQTPATKAVVSESKPARKVETKKAKKVVSESSSEQSDSSSSESKPVLSKSNKAPVKPRTVDTSRKVPKKKVKKVSQSSSEENSSSESSIKPAKKPIKPVVQAKPQTIVAKPAPNKTKETKVLKRKVISDQQSSLSKEKPKPQQQKPQPQTRKLALPASMRNQAAKSFAQHKELQWKPISRELREKHGASFISVPNTLRFKIAKLDEQKFVPVASNWIEGEVSSVVGSEITLGRVLNEDNQYEKQYLINVVNMLELEIKMATLSEEDAQKLKGLEQALDGSKSGHVETKPEKKPQSKSQPTQVEGDNSIQKYVCGQVNYYFTDKAYEVDLFFKLHANKHPEKYAPLKFILNYPKIKKVLQNQDKLLEYLIGDPQRDTRNYEFLEDQRLIRKKVTVVPVPTPAVTPPAPAACQEPAVTPTPEPITQIDKTEE